MSEGVRSIARALAHLIRDDVFVRVGYPPPTLPEQTRRERDSHPDTRDRLKRIVLATAPGRALRQLVPYLRLDPRFCIDLAQRATRPLRPHRRDILYWIGTDVMTCSDILASPDEGTRYRRRLRHFESITGIDRLTSELADVGISSITVPFPGREGMLPDRIEPMPSRFTVLTYVPDARRDFYGLPVIIEAARALPGIKFVVMGGTGSGVDAPPNLTFVGFVADTRPLYAGATVVVRHVRHDGAGYSVAEALLHGRQVIYTYPTPHTRYVAFGDSAALIAELDLLMKAHESGGVTINTDGRIWARREFDPHTRITALAGVLTAREAHTA